MRKIRTLFPVFQHDKQLQNISFEFPPRPLRPLRFFLLVAARPRQDIRGENLVAISDSPIAIGLKRSKRGGGEGHPKNFGKRAVFLRLASST